MTNPSRQSTPIDELAERWVDTAVDLEPTFGTYIGRNEVNDRFGDLSPSGHEEIARQTAAALRELQSLEPQDAVDEVTKDALSQELSLGLELHEARWHLRDLNVI